MTRPPRSRPRPVAVERPEQRLGEHDRLDRFDAAMVPPSSPSLNAQPGQGRMIGFDFGRDALDSKRPMQPFAEIMQMDLANKPIAMATQLALSVRRYHLTPSSTPRPGCRAASRWRSARRRGSRWGLDRERLSSMGTAEVKRLGAFPYPSLPRPKHTPGGMVFPPSHLAVFPRLVRFGVDHDLPRPSCPSSRR